jgi:predicted ArsR family transcriptional regulator
MMEEQALERQDMRAAEAAEPVVQGRPKQMYRHHQQAQREQEVLALNHQLPEHLQHLITPVVVALVGIKQKA